MFDFKKLKGKEVKKDSAEFDATKNVLNAIKKSAEDKMADGLKKVTVASNDEEGLKEGLDKAKEIVSSGEPEESLEEESLESSEESVEGESSDQEIDDLEKQLHEMMKKLEELKAKKA